MLLFSSIIRSEETGIWNFNYRIAFGEVKQDITAGLDFIRMFVFYIWSNSDRVKLCSTCGLQFLAGRKNSRAVMRGITLLSWIQWTQNKMNNGMAWERTYNVIPAWLPFTSKNLMHFQSFYHNMRILQDRTSRFVGSWGLEDALRFLIQWFVIQISELINFEAIKTIGHFLVFGVGFLTSLFQSSFDLCWSNFLCAMNAIKFHRGASLVHCVIWRISDSVCTSGTQRFQFDVP